MCCSDPPDNSEQYAAISAANRETAEIMAALGREQLQWAKDKYAAMEPIIQEFVSTQSDILKEQYANAKADRERYEQTFVPLEQEFAQRAKDYLTPERVAREVGRAVTGVTDQFAVQRKNAERRLLDYGLQPDVVARKNDAMGIAEAEAKAGAGNEAVVRTEAIGNSMLADAANFGRGLPSQVAGAYGQSLEAGNSGTGNLNNTYRSGSANLGNPTAYYGLQGDALGRWGANVNNQTQAQQAAYQMDGGPWGGLGMLAGAALGSPWVGKLFAEGGEVEGPGGPKDDAIPARLSDGEYIIPAEVVRAKGTEFFDKLVAKYNTTGEPPAPKGPGAGPIRAATGGAIQGAQFSTPTFTTTSSGGGGSPNGVLAALARLRAQRGTPMFARQAAPVMGGAGGAGTAGGASPPPVQRLAGSAENYDTGASPIAAQPQTGGGKGPRPTGVLGGNVSVHSPGDIAAATGPLSAASIGLGLVGPPFSGALLGLSNALANMGYAGVVHDPAIGPQDPALRSAIKQADDMSRTQRSTVSFSGSRENDGSGMAGGFGGDMSRGIANTPGLSGTRYSGAVSVSGSRENDGSGMAGGFGGSMSSFGGTRSGGLSGGGPGSGSRSSGCFAPHTLLLMADGSTKPAALVRRGDRLMRGGRVTAVMEFDVEPDDWRLWNGVYLTDEHAVCDNGRWVRVGDIREPIPFSSKTAYNFICDEHRCVVVAPDKTRHLTADYIEHDFHSTAFAGQNERALALLNGEQIHG
jgi:hypothetical protein